MLPLLFQCCQWTVEYTAHYGKNKPTSDSVHVVGECSSVVLEQNSEQDTLAALLVHSQSCGMTCSQLTLKWIRFGLVLIPRFALKIQWCSGLVFQLCILEMRVCCVPYGFLVSLCRTIVHQVCRVHEMLPLWWRSSQWTVPDGRKKPSSDSVHIVGESSSVAFEQNPMEDTLAALLVHNQHCRMKWTVDLFVSHWIFTAIRALSFCCVFWNWGFVVSVYEERFWIKDPEVLSEPSCTLFLMGK